MFRGVVEEGTELGTSQSSPDKYRRYHIGSFLVETLAHPTGEEVVGFRCDFDQQKQGSVASIVHAVEAEGLFQGGVSSRVIVFGYVVQWPRELDYKLRISVHCNGDNEKERSVTIHNGAWNIADPCILRCVAKAFSCASNAKWHDTDLPALGICWHGEVTTVAAVADEAPFRVAPERQENGCLEAFEPVAQGEACQVCSFAVGLRYWVVVDTHLAFDSDRSKRPKVDAVRPRSWELGFHDPKVRVHVHH